MLQYSHTTGGALFSYHLWCSVHIPLMVQYSHTTDGAVFIYHIWCSIHIPLITTNSFIPAIETVIARNVARQNFQKEASKNDDSALSYQQGDTQSVRVQEIASKLLKKNKIV